MAGLSFLFSVVVKVVKDMPSNRHHLAVTSPTTFLLDLPLRFASIGFNHCLQNNWFCPSNIKISEAVRPASALCDQVIYVIVVAHKS